jgi:hypothetical protein
MGQMERFYRDLKNKIELCNMDIPREQILSVNKNRRAYNPARLCSA